MSEGLEPEDDSEQKPEKEPRSPLAIFLLAIWYILLGTFTVTVLAVIAVVIICSV